ncbi:restriction system modified-DNA reader domain-containing protein [Nocardia acidivorans]|uniref:restriction system modified-DNA reader domain-containing protein n=1 Tax=Nocardia acidivorans TaxID=404580 RepID=UPI00082AFECD|nr:hypothetical protein [Nocardia acidivorans]
MHHYVTARLDESYTHLLTGQRVVRERHVAFEVVEPPDCNHHNGETICTECAPGWQLDYDFADPFAFARVDRVTVADLLAAGMLTVGATLVMDEDTATTAVVTDTGGLMLSDGRVFDNPSAAANAALTS